MMSSSRPASKSYHGRGDHVLGLGDPHALKIDGFKGLATPDPNFFMLGKKTVVGPRDIADRA